MAKMGLSKVAIEETANRHRDDLVRLIADKRLCHHAGKIFESERMPNATPEDVVRYLSVHVDPDSKGRYSKWLVKRAIARDREMAHLWRITDATVTNRLQRYDEIKPHIPIAFRDIQFFQSVGMLNDFLDTVVETDFKSVRQMDRDREDRLFASGEADIIHDDEKCKVLHIKSVEAAYHFGRNTKWCVTSMQSGHFETYNATRFLYYIILRGSNQRYAFAVGKTDFQDQEFRNASNHHEYFSRLETLCPEAATALVKAAQNHVLQYRREVYPSFDHGGLTNGERRDSLVDVMARRMARLFVERMDEDIMTILRDQSLSPRVRPFRVERVTPAPLPPSPEVYIPLTNATTTTTTTEEQSVMTVAEIMSSLVRTQEADRMFQVTEYIPEGRRLPPGMRIPPIIDVMPARRRRTYPSLEMPEIRYDWTFTRRLFDED